MLACYRYIELNPIRAGMVEHPAEYCWSSYRHNAQGELLPLLSGHAAYEGLGTAEDSRREAYRGLFRAEMEPALVDEIRQATHGNYALGSSRVKAEAEEALGRRVSRGKAGRKRLVKQL